MSFDLLRCDDFGGVAVLHAIQRIVLEDEEEGIGEARIAEWLAGFLRGLGAHTELREVLPGRPNVVARFPSDRPGKPRLLLAPHTDTVSVVGMTIPPFAADLRDGRVWGRGASDTKGSMAAMLWALRAMRERLPALGHEIWFAGLASEEAGQHGSKALAREEAFDFVIVGEPTGLDVVHTHKGCAFLQLRTTGRAGHAARPELGENAIAKMLDVLAFVRGELAREFAAIHDACEASVDMRFVPAQFAPGFVEKIIARLRAICPDLAVDLSPAPPLATDPAHPLIAKLGECGARPVGAPWFCDACFFAERGTPAVALGPGSIAQAHTRDEFIEVADLEEGVEFFTNFLGRL